MATVGRLELARGSAAGTRGGDDLGIDTAANLEKLAAGLAVDRSVRGDADATVHCVADDGHPIALRIWAKRPVVSITSPVNMIGANLMERRGWKNTARHSSNMPG